MRRHTEDVQVEDVLPGEAGGWELGSLGAAANTVTVLRRTAWGLMVAGPVLAVWALLSRPAPAAPVTPVRQEQPTAGQPAGPGGFAELFVSAYLAAGEGSEDSLAPFLPTARDVTLTAAPGAQRAQELAVVRVQEVSSGYWSVTVAARVASTRTTGTKAKAEKESGSAAGSVLRYFQVPVRSSGGGALAAAALPAEVGAPLSGEAPSLAYRQSVPVPATDPAGQTLSGFFAAYLAGSGQLDRYLSPGTALSPISPAPYARIEVAQVADTGTNDPGAQQAVPADGARRELLVQVAATDTAGQQRPLAYAIAIAARDGRWEIASAEGAPVLSKDSARTDEKETQ
ncbi:conjugative transposon protein TcpC [Streptomyces sp. CEV 2-1]|uniref:conjugal transfer protein n=1 Tax=Streptomyces sp. CEV 2-1 TaxID=2485153 RepID=UPI000FBDCFD9|nr:conjugal transfer protein [Streptomyces sp. CEV 2-1]ROQ65206.1 conjugative transposon protein TcpC [Streptomyces sp. CEV 2-1]